MKRYFTLIFALVASISFCYSMEAVSYETKKVSFVQSERKKIDCDDFERSNNFPILDAFYNSESNDVEIELCNGYYVSGVFKLNDSNIEHDPGTSYGGDTNYNNLLKVITYDKP